jgi:hypothetical protein
MWIAFKNLGNTVFENGVVKPSLNSVLFGLAHWVEWGGREETAKKHFVSMC